MGGHAGDVYSTVVGQGANATYVYATAVGNSSTASGSYSTALGYGTSAQGSSTTAIGGANANGTNLTVIGKGSTASASSWYDTISNSTAIGGAHISASDAAAIGSNATVNGQYGVALGYNSNVSYQSTGVGTGTKASNTGTAVGYGAQSSGYQSAAVGAGSNATGQNAVSLGGGGAWGDYSIALGSGAGTTAHGIAIGQNSGAWGENAIAIGEGTNAWRANSIVLGKNSKSGADKNIEGYDPRTGVASVDDTSTWYSTDEAVSIGRAEERDDGGNITASAITRQLNNLAAGTLDTDAVNVAQLKAATQKVNMHDYSVWSPDTETDTNYTNGGAIAKNSMAAGVSAGATGENAVAIGYGAKAKGRSATVIGKNASATGQYAMAFGGLDTTDKKGNPVTMTNTASGASATAFGQGAQAKGAASLAFGHNTVAGGDDGSGQQSVAFGEDTQALGGRSLAFGEKTIAKYNDSVAFGNDTRASSTGATAFGNRTRALSSYSTAWGNATVAADEESTAWGTDTIAGAKLDVNGAVTNIYTYKNNPDDKNEQAKTATEQMDVHGNLAYIQPNGKTAGIKQMPIDSGTEKHDYVVLAGKDGNTYVRDYQGSLWKVNVAADGTGTVDTTAGTNGKVYNGKNGAKQSLATTTVNGAEVAITPDNVLTKAHEGSNGYNIDGYANATAFGYSTEASGDNATAFGNDTKAAGAGATAFGYKTLASGENATAFGESSIAAGKNSLAALGGTTTDAATNAAAIGNGAKATLADSVALGSGAVADRKSGAKGYDMLTKGDTTNTTGAWVSSANAIAVGNGSTLTRQITGVAAGSQDTDAVNVAQLKAAGFKVTTQNNGNISSSIFTGDTLDFEGKDNAIVSTSKDSKTITVAVSKTPTFDSATFYNSTGSNNEKVTIANGQVSAFNGDQKKRAAVGVDNQGNGTLFLVNDDLSQAHLYTQSSKETGNDGITRMYYTSSTDNDGEVNGVHTIAVLDDGINYAGDNVKPNTSEKVVVKHKLNSTMDITGGADTNNLSKDGNIGVVSTPAVEDKQGNITQKAKLELKLNKDLTGLNTVTAGTAKIGSAPADVLKLTENGAVTEKTAPAGSYVTGLDNKDWDVSSPTYVSGRAATEDQLKKVGDAVNSAAATAGKHTVVTVNDKDGNNETAAKAGTGAFGDYAGADKGNLLIAAKNDNGQMTYNIKLNDQLAIGQKGEPGVAGKDGKVTVETKGGTTVVIGHDGEPGKDGRDGLFVTGKDGADGKSGVSITGPNGVAGTDGVDGKVGIAGKDGKDAVSIVGKGGVGHIGLTGPKGEKGKDGISIGITTDLKSATLDDGKNVKTVIKDKEGKETTIEQAPRIQYKSGDNIYEVATMDDGLKFVGDDGTATPVTKKLNSTLQIRGDGTYDETTKQSNGNIQTSVKDGTIKVALNDKINLHQDGSLTVGGDKQDDSTDSKDPIVIKHFDDKTLDVIGVDKDGKPTTSKEGKAGDYVTGLDNKDWDVDHPTYVSGRAATEDQLKKVSDAVNSAAATAGKHTVVTVNDKDSNETKAEAGTGVFGNYAGADKGNLLIAAKNDNDQMTYNIKLNDQLAIGQKGEPGVAGKDGKDGKVTVETKGGTTVVIGHDGKDGDNGKDGLFVTGPKGKDGKDGIASVSITGPDGQDGIDGKIAIGTPGKDGQPGKDAVSISGQNGEGHIGLTGPAGKDGKDASADIHVKNGQVGVDGTDGNNGKDGMDRIVYDDHNGKPHEVATMDDGMKFVGNDGKEVAKKLNSTLSLTGGITDGDALKKASSKNLGVRSNKDGDGLEIVMTDTPDFTKVTVGEGDDMTKKITIGKQTVTGKKSDSSTADQPQTGNYITGLDNKAWDKDNVVENRAATEGQLRDIAGSITNQTQGGGFALTSDEKGDDKIVKQDLGKAIQIKGDTTYKTDGSVEKAGNIKTSIDNGAIKVGLNKDVDLGNDGSVKAGNTTIDKDGVETNKVKVGGITITDQGINGGTKQITNIASGLDSTKHYADPIDNNAASIGDVKQLAQQEAQASEARSGKNITVKDDHTVNLNDDITLGDDPNKQVAIHGSNGQVTIGSGDKTLTLGQQANGAGDKNPATGNFLNGLDNRNWDGEHIQNGRAATEDQLKTVSDKVKSGRVFQGDDGQKVTVGLGDTLKIQGGAREVSRDDNIGIVKGADDTLNVRLAKDLTGLNSVTTGNTTITNGGLTIHTSDANRTITMQDGNVNMGGNQIHHVAPGQAPDDAVNVSQLNATNYAVNKLDTRVNRVGANAAALAALHPLDFDPDDKWDFSAGYGHYKDASAAAVGAFYRPNEDTMFSVGGSFGGGENMVNAGVSVKLGQGNHVSTSRVAMAKEIKDLKKDVAALKAVVNQQSALIDKLTGVNAGELSGSDDLFPDVPANHWAYEYVTRLKQAGILTGYPDGNFAGDRMMTRYEFAAIVYRAIMAGAAANPSLNKDGTLDRLSKEFSSEMKYIRIDTIRKDRNGRPTIQRVRVIKEDEKEK